MVSQVAATLSVAQSEWNPGSSAQESSSVSITSNVSWTASSDSEWLSVNKTSGSGNDSFKMSVTKNPSIYTDRTGVITISNSTFGLTKTITVTQSKSVPSLSVSTSSWSPNCGKQTSSSISITSDVDWTATSSASWLTLSSSSGSSGTKTITLSVLGNNSTSSRSATVTIKNATLGISKTISVSQYGYTKCAVSISSKAIDLGITIDRTGTYTFVIKGWSSNGGSLLGLNGMSDSNDWRFFKNGNYYYFDWGSSRISYSYSTSITGSYRKFVLSNYAMKYYASESTTSTTWTKSGTTQSSIPSSTATIRVGSASESLTFKSLVVNNSGGTTTHNFIGVQTNGTTGIFDTTTGVLVVGGSYVSL